MARLIHLNGGPGAGKSTLAHRYVDEHPGVLNLDVDQIVFMIGGWRDGFGDALVTARALAAEMATAHLRAGHDVVLPQLVALEPAEAHVYERAAARARASYVEVVLMVDPAEQEQRFRAKSRDGTAVDRHIESWVDSHGCLELLTRIREQHLGYLEIRPAHRLDTDCLDADETYAALLAVLDPSVGDD